MRRFWTALSGDDLFERTLKVLACFVDFKFASRFLRRSVRVLEPLRKVPEEKVKEAFAEIIGEPTVPKDWGGERSDLFSSRVELDGKRISSGRCPGIERRALHQIRTLLMGAPRVVGGRYGATPGPSMSHGRVRWG